MPPSSASFDALAGEVAKVVSMWTGGGLVVGLVLGVVLALALGSMGAFSTRSRASGLLAGLLGTVFVGVTTVFGTWVGGLVGIERAVSYVTADAQVRSGLLDPVGAEVAWEGLLLLAASPGTDPATVTDRAQRWRQAGSVPYAELEAAGEAWRQAGVSPESLSAMLDTLQQLAGDAAVKDLPQRHELRQLRDSMRSLGVDDAAAEAWARRAEFAGRDGDAAQVSRVELGALFVEGLLVPAAVRATRTMVVVGLVTGFFGLALGWAVPLGFAWLLGRPPRPPRPPAAAAGPGNLPTAWGT